MEPALIQTSCCPECEQFSGRDVLRCNGSVMDSRKTTVWRSRRGLSAIGEPQRDSTPNGSQKPLTTPAKRPPKPQKHQPMTKFPGKNLARLLNHYGVPTKESCGCEPWVKAMDQGPEWCRANFDEIQERLETKAAELRTKETVLIGVRMLLDWQWPTIASLINRAIREAEERR